MQENEATRKAGKGKLEERLAAKRARKERELLEQEERARKELAERQAAELEERERLKRAKMQWSECLQEAEDQAADMGLVCLEKEDYCLQMTLGQKLVPDAQINACIERVMGARHSDEMAALLSQHFEDRIAALKMAVEKLIEEKAQARVELTERLTAHGADAATFSQEMAALESMYNAKQASAEKKATSDLEPVHMKQQLSMRQQQLAEMSRVAAVYMDPEALVRMQSETGKSQVEEMAEYRARVESEKKAREAAMLQERIEAEATMRSEHEEHMRKMREQMEDDQRRIAAEFERTRQQVNSSISFSFFLFDHLKAFFSEEYKY